MAVKAAREVYSQAKVTPEEVDVVELHDCFSTNELITYEALVQSIAVAHMYRIAGNFEGENFHEFHSLRATCESFLHEIWTYSTHL